MIENMIIISIITMTICILALIVKLYIIFFNRFTRGNKLRGDAVYSVAEEDEVIRKGQRNFWQLPEVHWVLIIVGVISFFMFLSIGLTCLGDDCISPFEQELNGHYRSWDHFLTIFSVPLKLLAASVGVLGVIALNHRAEQTNAQMILSQRQIARSDLQIKLTQKQNSFANHFKHMDDFEQFVRERNQEEFFAKHTNTVRSFYRANFDNTEYDNNFIYNVIETVKEIVILLQKFEVKPRMSAHGIPTTSSLPVVYKCHDSEFSNNICTLLGQIGMDYKNVLYALDSENATIIVSYLSDIIKIIHITIDFQGKANASDYDQEFLFLENILKNLNLHLEEKHQNQWSYSSGLYRIKLTVDQFLVK